MAMDQQRNLVCTVPGCERKFKTKVHMLQHQADSHKKHLSSSSNTTPKTTLKPDIPNVNKKVACYHCGEKFGDYIALHQHQQASPSHVRVCGERSGNQFTCHVCKSAFELADYLDQHFLSRHSVVSLEKTNPDRVKQAGDFIGKWRHPGTKGTIIDILHIYNPGHRTKRFEDYRNKLKAGNKDMDQRIRENGNEVTRFHGTTVKCGLGTDGISTLCSDLECNLCNIIKGGFKKKKAKVNGFLRFGKGIYVTATSSKANDYVMAYKGWGSTRRAMLVCWVLAGRVYKVRQDCPELDKPPVGFDSVCGEVGGSLNYDELVVYENAAILPAYIIVYSM